MSKIKVNNLSHSYDGKLVIDDLIFSIDPHEITSIVGISGCGKSTLIKILANLVTPDSGKVELCDIEIAAKSVIFQDSTLLNWKSVRKNIELVKTDTNKTVEEIAKIVGLHDSLELFPYELSGGMKQRAEFARAIARSTDFLLMDEPFSKLDVQFKAAMQDTLLEIQDISSPTTVLVTHDIREAIKVSSHIIVMLGKPADAVETYTVKEFEPALLIEEIEQKLFKEFKRFIEP